LGKVQKRVHKAVQDGEIKKGDFVDDGFGLGWELDFGIRGKSKLQSGRSRYLERIRRSNRYFITCGWLQDTGNRQTRPA
jgi:hypothetical protein